MADYITMKQVPGGVVTAKDDRIVYDANMADSGIIYGCEITYAGNNMIHIGAGYGIIKGGMFEMEDHTEYVDLAENEPTTGQIYLHLDLSADDKLTIVKETTNSLHPMVQNANANFTNGIYELQLCTFTATTTALEDVTQTFAVIQNQVLDTLPEIMANTTAGLKAGALALKEVSENLNAIQVLASDEVKVGTWFGKDRYRKCWRITTPYTTNGDFWLDQTFTSDYVEDLVKLDFVYLDNESAWAPVFNYLSASYLHDNMIRWVLKPQGLRLTLVTQQVARICVVAEYTKA